MGALSRSLGQRRADFHSRFAAACPCGNYLRGQNQPAAKKKECKLTYFVNNYFYFFLLLTLFKAFTAAGCVCAHFLCQVNTRGSSDTVNHRWRNCHITRQQISVQMSLHKLKTLISQTLCHSELISSHWILHWVSFTLALGLTQSKFLFSDYVRKAFSHVGKKIHNNSKAIPFKGAKNTAGMLSFCQSKCERGKGERAKSIRLLTPT